MNLDKFAVWLAGEGLAETTRAQKLVDVRLIVRLCKEGTRPPVRLHFAGATLVAWAEAEDIDISELDPILAWLVSDETKKEATSGSKTRKKPARSFAPEDWKRLARAIVADESNEGRVLEAVMMTGLRIGDVLRIEKKQVERAVAEEVLITTVKGGEQREIYTRGVVKKSFEKLLDAWSGTKGGASRRDISAWIMPVSKDVRPYFGAYQRVSRKLKLIASTLGLDGRVHLHRMRRTIAMQALSQTKDIGVVQQLLGHSQLATTLRYVDEERPEEVAKLRESVHTEFLEEK